MSAFPAVLVPLIFAFGPAGRPEGPRLGAPPEAAPRREAPSSLAQFNEEGRREFAARHYSQALRAFRKALKSAEGDAAVKVRGNIASCLGALGAEYFNAGENRLAEKAFRDGLEEADNYYSHFGLGYLYFLRADDGSALDHLQSALTLRPEFAGTHKLLALLAYRRGDGEAARERMREAARLDRSDRETAILLERWETEAGFLSTFRERSTPFFRFRLDPALPEGSFERVGAELDAARGRLGDRLGVWPEEPVVVVLYSEKTFYEATGSRHWVGGMYDGQLKLPVVAPQGRAGAVEGSGASLREVVLHEYAHVLVHAMASECPVWLNEGIAQHFERERDLSRVLRLVGRDRKMRRPFRELPSRLWAVGDARLARWSYLQGLGFVEYLSDRYGEFRLRLLLWSIGEEHSLERAFERTYGRALSTLEEEWWRTVDRAVSAESAGSNAKEDAAGTGGESRAPRG